VIANTFMI